MVEPVEDSLAWAESNFGQCDLGDVRRTNRTVKIASRMADNPGASSPRQINDWAELKACYRFFNTKAVTFDALAEPHWKQTCDRARGRVLVISDTTEISYGNTRKISGLGTVGKGTTYGFYLHNALMVVAENGEVLGLGRQELFHRISAPAKENRRQKSRRPRETEVWGRVVDAIGPAPEGAEYVHVCDRGGDNLELFCHLQKLNCQWVIRCSHLNRHVHPIIDGELGAPISVNDALRDAVVLGTQTLSLRGRGGKKSRTVKLEIRCCEVFIPQPRRRSPYLRSVDFRGMRQTLIEVREINPKRGKKPLRWVLWTRLFVHTLEDASIVVEYYEQRWLVEELHKGMKTGCQLEARQYETAHCLEGLAAISSVLAVRLLQLKQLARAAPATPANKVVPRAWLRVLEIFRKKSIPTVRDFIRNLAALGGFLMRKHDGEPGWITIWKGTENLIVGLKMYDALHKKCG